jgi:hypothetical protein
MDRKKLALIMTICGGVAVLGTLLSWVVVDGPFASGSAPGTDSTKGVFVLILSLAGGAAALLLFLGKAGELIKLDERQHLLIGTGCLAVALLLVFTQMVSGDYETVKLADESFGTRRGFGLWLDMLATIGGVAAGVMALRPSGSPAPTEPADE